MKIIGLFNRKKPVIAFEIFPPRPDIPLETIYDSLDQFKMLHPDYISVTYGAGGSQKGRTIEIASKITDECGIESMAHLTCVGHTIDEIDSILDTMHDKQLSNILALRGDPPVNQPDFDFSKGAYKYANELIRHIKTKNSFCVSAAAHIEGHIESKRLKDNMLHLKEKVDEGVDFLVTQFFFDNRLFYDFLDKADAIGMKCPVAAGIMPLYKADQIKAMTAKSGCSIPAKVVLMMDKYQDNLEDMTKAGIEYASNQISDLIENGVDGVHLYTMNRPKSTRLIMQNLGRI